jgi:hypothetical protein
MPPNRTHKPKRKQRASDAQPAIFGQIVQTVKVKGPLKIQPDAGTQQDRPKLTVKSVTFIPARDTDAAEAQNYGPDMAAQQEPITIAKDGTLLKGGVRYFPLSEAASLARAHRTTLLRWIKDDTKGRQLQTYYFSPSDTYFISEDSIKKLANRFLKWPSEEPAGPVTLGETRDRSGFIGMSEAADIAGVSRRTMWLWVSQGKAPTDNPPDIIKDPMSEHFYIREKDIYDLKKLIPKRGLQRGRRPHLAFEP